MALDIIIEQFKLQRKVVDALQKQVNYWQNEANR